MPRGKKTPDPEVVVEAEVTTTTAAASRGRNGTATRSRARPATTQAIATPQPGPSLVALGLQTAILHEQLTALQRQVAEVTQQAEEARAALQALRDDIARGLGRPEPPPSSPARAASRPEARAEPPPEESKSGEKVEPPAHYHGNRLGVTVGNGVVVAEVLPDSPAAAAGVARGDVIEEADGHGILSGTMLRSAVDKARPTGVVRLKVFRAGASREISIPILAAEVHDGPGLGITVGPGVVVAGVVPDSPAAAAGLATGDVIDDLNGKPVHSSDGLRHAVHHLFDGEEAVLRVARAGEVRELRARLSG